MLVNLAVCTSYAQHQKELKGQVVDESGRPLEFASIYVKELEYTTFSGAKGGFVVRYPAAIDHLTIRVSSIGKITSDRRMEVSAVTALVVFRLKELSLTLDSVTVNPLFGVTTKSNSSIVFDEEAIERVQAFSLMDILNTIPGRATVAPNINAPQTITLRGNLGGAYDLNNSLGVPIMIDGVLQSNDANMQSRSVSQFGIAGSILGGANATNASDVPFQGMDLRDIPVETIERVEVIQGVASAEYGEMTDGAIIVDRKAGSGPYQFTTSINGGSTNYSIGKGFRLPGSFGAMNLGLNYAISNPDPRDKIKQYGRLATSMIWSKNFGQKIKNTFSFDYNKRDDDVKLDPDDPGQQLSFSRNVGVRLSNRFALRLNSKLAKHINLTASYSESNQHTYKQWLLNGPPKGYAFKDTTGIYEGVIVAGRYIAEEEIMGNPITASANLRLSTYFSLNKITHAITYGGNFNYSNNGGKGIIADPERPRWINSNGQNARPYSFKQLDPLLNLGVYVMDNFSFDLAGKRISSNIGVRYDRQNGSGSLQPRISTMMSLNKKWSVDAAFGISSKSPTMAHRYPAPTWFDVPLILSMNSKDELYLVYTRKYLADNSDLKPSKASQLEAGLRYNDRFLNSRLNFFFKVNRNGFQTVKYYKKFLLPEYEYHYDESIGQIVYRETGEMKTSKALSDNHIENVLNSNTFGLDWMLSSKTIRAINTSFTTSTSFILGDENNDYLEMEELSAPVVINGEETSLLLFEPVDNDIKYSLTSKFGTTTHIPKLGFVVSTMLDMYWLRRTKRDERIIYARGYENSQGALVMLSEGARIPEASKEINASDTRQLIVYGNFNMSVAKEIRKNLRIGVTAYNVLNIRPEVTTIRPGDLTELTTTFNSPVSITGSITIKF